MIGGMQRGRRGDDGETVVVGSGEQRSGVVGVRTVDGRLDGEACPVGRARMKREWVPPSNRRLELTPHRRNLWVGAAAARGDGRHISRGGASVRARKRRRECRDKQPRLCAHRVCKVQRPQQPRTCTCDSDVSSL